MITGNYCNYDASFIIYLALCNAINQTDNDQGNTTIISARLTIHTKLTLNTHNHNTQPVVFSYVFTFFNIYYQNFKF